MVEFDDMPSAIDADFTQWNADTVVELHSVAWNNDYRDIVDWGTAANRDSWFDNRPISARTKIENMEYARINAPIVLEIPFSRAYRYNYVRVINGPQTPVFNQAQSFFYFITEISPDAPGATRISVQLDVWTTFGHEANFGQSYVERGHIGIANANNFDNFGRDFLTVPEGMDIGNEYQVAYHVNREVMNNKDREHNETNMNIIVASTVEFEATAGDVDNPSLNSAKGDNVQGLPSGASYYLFTFSNFKKFMEVMSKKPWVTQGIISISAIPPVDRYGATWKAVSVSGMPNGAVSRLTSQYGSGVGFNMLANWRNNVNLLNMIPEKYRKLRKFFTFPYMVLELTNFAGAPVMLKPELWNDPNAWMSEKAVFAAPNQRIVHHPVKYNAGRNSTVVEKTPQSSGPGGSIFEDNGEYLDVAVHTTNLPTFALVNNGYLAFMGANANSIGASFQQADWSQQKALEGNRVSYDQANSSIATGASNAAIARNTDIYSTRQTNDTALLGGLLDGGTKIASGAMGGPVGLAGGVAGAATGAARTLLGMNNASAQLNIRNNAAVATQANTQNNQQFLADTNKGLADWAARGDYSTAINQIQAKLQDARMTQPSVSGQAGGDVFNLIHGGIMISLRFKMISYNAMTMIGDYWLRYGYAVSRFMRIDKLSVMENFTFWKIQELYLVNTNLPEFIKQAIRGIFEKGVTVWRDATKIGAIDLSDNDPLSGIVIPVDPVPEIIPPEPEPLNPNLDEVDEMYLAKTTDVNGPQYWGIGKEYLNALGTSNAGTVIPVKLVGQDFTEMTSTEFASALRFANIPDRYVSLPVFLEENPDGVWSRADENAAAIANVQASAAANQTATQEGITSILTLLSPPDSGTGAN